MPSGRSALALGVRTFWLGILVVFVLINLMVDLLYAYIDPRIDCG